MFATELIPVYPGRPPVLRFHNAWIYVSVHDQDHIRHRSIWRQLLASKHPDRGGPPGEFRSLMTQYAGWLQREKAWYAQLGLEPIRSISSPQESPGIEQPPSSLTFSCSVCGLVSESRSGNRNKFCSRLCQRIHNGNVSHPRPRNPAVEQLGDPESQAGGA